MRPPLRLTSLDNPRIKHLLHLRKQRDRRGQGVFVAEGLREISRAMDAGLKLRELFWSPQMTGQSFDGLVRELPRLAASEGAVFEITPAMVSKVSNLEHPEGLLAIFQQPTWRLADIPADPTRPDLLLIATGISKPGNLGAMARTASAAGATALLAADAVVDPFNPNAIRASTGAVFSLPIISAGSDELIAFVHRRSARIFAATPQASVPYYDADMLAPVALVIGAEDAGVPPQWLEAADRQITIPMHTGVVDSLNASNAAAILLFECQRQRRTRQRS